MTVMDWGQRVNSTQQRQEKSIEKRKKLFWESRFKNIGNIVYNIIKSLVSTFCWGIQDCEPSVCDSITVWS